METLGELDWLPFVAKEAVGMATDGGVTAFFGGSGGGGGSCWVTLGDVLGAM